MLPPAGSRILLCAATASAVDDLRHILEQAGHGVATQLLESFDPEHLSSFALVILEGSRSTSEALSLCKRLRIRTTDNFLPILFVTADHGSAIRLASLEHGADTYLLRPFAPGEVLAQVQAFLRIKNLHDRLVEKTTELHRLNQKLELSHLRVEQELELARRIQRSFLPHTLPVLPGTRFAVHYRPCGRVGGDFYDVFRLDENHVGFYVADAMGHGVPASLLTIFLKKAIRAKDISGKDYRLVPPNEVLQRLNRDLLDQGLADAPFITMVYALFNYQDGSLQFARAGHPYPLRIPTEGDPELWKIEGSLLGVFETQFNMRSLHLDPGDKLLFYTDGSDAVSFENKSAGIDSLMACASRHRNLPIQDFVDRISGDLFHQNIHLDDWTLLGLQVGA